MAAVRKPHPSFLRSPWANEWNVDYLKARWGIDTPRAVAEVVGTTRSAVIGKAHRLGLPDLGDPVHGGLLAQPRPRKPYDRRQEKRTWRERKAKILGVPVETVVVRKHKAKSPVDVQPRRVPEVSALPLFSGTKLEHRSAPVTLADIDRNGCRWPVGEGSRPSERLFCGNPAEPDCSWCSEHRVKATDQRKTEESRANLPSFNPWSMQARRAAE